jgi:hypothetical protein
MYNSIILSSCLFGSIYLCSTSLILINQGLLQNNKIPNKLIILNSFMFVAFGSIFLYNGNFFHFTS